MRTIPRRVWILVLLLTCMAASGCPSGCDELTKLLNPTGTSVESVTISPVAAQLTVGQTQQFTGTVLPTGVSDRSVTWSVAPTGLATIDTNGILTAQAPGAVIVTAVSVATPVHTAQAAVTIAGSTLTPGK